MSPEFLYGSTKPAEGLGRSVAENTLSVVGLRSLKANDLRSVQYAIPTPKLWEKTTTEKSWICMSIRETVGKGGDVLPRVEKGKSAASRYF